MTELTKQEKRKIAQHEWYLKNKDRVLQKKQQWRASNPDKVKQAMKRYRQKKKEDLEKKKKILEYHAQYRKNNKEYFKQYNKQYYKDMRYKALRHELIFLQNQIQNDISKHLEESSVCDNITSQHIITGAVIEVWTENGTMYCKVPILCEEQCIKKTIIGDNKTPIHLNLRLPPIFYYIDIEGKKKKFTKKQIRKYNLLEWCENECNKTSH